MPDRDVNVRLNLQSQGQDRVKAALTDVGTMVARAGAAFTSFATAASSIGRAVTSVAGVAGSDAAGGVGSLVGTAGSAVSGVMKALGGLAAAAGPAGIAVAAVAGVMGQLVEQAAQFVATAIRAVVTLVGLHNPYAVERLNRAWEDLQAVLGRALTPVVERFTQVIRVLGDFLATIFKASDLEGTMKEMDKAIEALRQSLAEIAPIIRRVVITALQELAQHAQAFARAVSSLPEWIKRGMGISGEAPPLDSSMGAAARPASLIGLQDVATRAQQAAFSVGASDAKRTADAAEKGLLTLEQFLEFLRRLESGWTPGLASASSLGPAQVAEGIRLAMEGMR